MRVLISIMVFHPVIGGTEGSAKELAAALVRQGHQVDVVTLRHPGLPAHEVLDGVHVHRVLLGVGRHLVFALSYLGSLIWFLLRHRRYGVIQVYFAYLDAVTVALLRPWLGCKGVVVRLGGGGQAGDLARLRRLSLSGVFLPLIKRLDRFVVVSQQMRQELLETGFDASRILVIHNGVDTQVFSPSHPATELAPGGTVVTVARLSQEKGCHVLLEAWRQVRDALPESRLVIVGDGPQRTALQQQATRLGLNGAVTFAGEVADVRGHLQTCGVFVLPSLSEGMPNALLQAMAMGLPCLATRVGGVEELVQDRVNGRLTEPGNPAALAQLLQELLTDGDQAARLGQAARRTVESRFTIEQMIDGYLRVYGELTKEQGG